MRDNLRYRSPLCYAHCTSKRPPRERELSGGVADQMELTDMQSLAIPPATLTRISEFTRGYDQAASLDPVERYAEYRARHRDPRDDFGRGFQAMTLGDHEAARR